MDIKYAFRLFQIKNLDAAAWSEELIVKEILRLFPFKNIFLEAATAKEYAELFPVPLYFEQLTDNARKLLECVRKSHPDSFCPVTAL